MPKLSELDGCLAADRTNVTEKVRRIRSKKLATKKDLYLGLLKAKKVIDKNPEKSHSLANLAKTAGIAESHFQRSFKEAFQQSPKQYQIELKLDRARDLLMKTKLNVTEICARLGFKSLGSFSNLFKAKMGLSPLGLRRKLAGIDKRDIS